MLQKYSKLRNLVFANQRNDCFRLVLELKFIKNTRNEIK